MILDNIDSSRRVLDLGAGTGLLTYYWFKECKTADYVLVDIADEMLNISRERFAGLVNIYHKILDYTKQLPEGEFDTIISALSMFDSYWEKQIYNSGLTDSDIEQWKERKQLDKECSVEEEIEVLKECGFSDVKCVKQH